MQEAPIRTVLQALDALDADGVTRLFAPEGILTTAFGERVEGRELVDAVLRTFLKGLRSTRHQLASEWNPEPGVWIAEMSATYELTDYSQRGPYRRAIIVRGGDDGIVEMRIYGQHELSLWTSGRGYAEVHDAHGGWLPTL